MPGRAATKASRTRTSVAAQKSPENTSARPDHFATETVRDGRDGGTSLLAMIDGQCIYSEKKRQGKKRRLGPNAKQLASTRVIAYH